MPLNLARGAKDIQRNSQGRGAPSCICSITDTDKAALLLSLPGFLSPFHLTNPQALIFQEAFTTLQVDWPPLLGSHPPLALLPS